MQLQKILQFTDADIFFFSPKNSGQHKLSNMIHAAPKNGAASKELAFSTGVPNYLGTPNASYPPGKRPVLAKITRFQVL